jgi:hypothetical protein
MVVRLKHKTILQSICIQLLVTNIHRKLQPKRNTLMCLLRGLFLTHATNPQTIFQLNLWTKLIRVFSACIFIEMYLEKIVINTKKSKYGTRALILFYYRYLSKKVSSLPVFSGFIFSELNTPRINITYRIYTEWLIVIYCRW